jgi:tetratricopeptide (TPR) repeat protein
MQFEVITRRISGFVLFMLALVIFSGSVSYADNVQPQALPSQKLVNLTVKTNPPGGMVFIDNALKGQAPLVTPIEVGKHRIRISMGTEWVPYVDEKLYVHDDILKVNLITLDRYPYENGKKAFFREDIGVAIESFNKALTRKEPVPDSYFYLGLLYRRMKNNDEMLKNFNKYVQLNPTSGDFVDTFTEINPEPLNYAVIFSHYLLGEYYSSRKEWKKATDEFKMAIPGFKPSKPKEMAPTRENISKLEVTVKNNPNDFDSFIQLGYLFNKKKMDYYEMQAYGDAARVMYMRSRKFLTLLASLGGIDS